MTNQNPSVHYVAFTHSGKQHHQNQDAILLPKGVQQQAGSWQQQLTLDSRLRFAIADGAGGLPSADKASRSLLQALLQLDIDKPDLAPRSRLLPLHHRFSITCKQNKTQPNAGATLITAEIAPDGQIALWHAGDSRGYHLKADGLHRLTEDHTLAYTLKRGSRSILPRKSHCGFNLGEALDNLFIYAPEASEPDYIGLQWLRLLPGELLLLVSDGVTLHLSDEDLAACLSGEDLATMFNQLFEVVMTAGAEDNLSAIAISIN